MLEETEDVLKLIFFIHFNSWDL